MRPIRLVRPRYNIYKAIGQLINEDENIYDLTRNQFIGKILRLSGGCLNPCTVGEIYDELMKEAGINETN